jgi:hypothetical protein
VFSFVVIADPHLYGSQDAADRLAACVDWVNASRAAESIELVFVAGDLGSRLADAKALLDGLDVPHVPVIGDNSIQSGREVLFDEVFGPHYATLATTLENWSRAPVPVPNTEHGGESYFQNVSFDHRGVHFLGLDWCTRHVGGLEGEQADLHAMPGGTWPWFTNDLDACPKPRLENVVMVSHHPMHDLLGGAGAFSGAEMDLIEAYTKVYADHVYADFAGHYHFPWYEGENAGGFELYVTDATHDDDNTLRLVRVFDDGTRFTYEHEFVVLETGS